MEEQLEKIYDPKSIESQASAIWSAGNYFHAGAGAKGAKGSYTIVIPPPNVTAALHLGHALNNTLQDILIRFRRMQGFNTLWMPGTDHAGIATQTVVEKRLLAEEGKRRTEYEREDFVGRVQEWKDEYEACILGQLKSMGCSCDWQRTRFTMDEVCAKAVRENFFRLFRDGLIYRGKRLVNWDPVTQTVLADDEVEHETVHGHFWYMRYPLVEPVEVPCAGAAGDSLNHGQGARAAPTGRMPVPRGTAFQAVDHAVHKRSGAYLPHWTQAGATYAVTFRLADSLPAEAMARWRVERQRVLQQAKAQGRELTRHEQEEIAHLFSERVESYLDAGHGECVLQDRRVAEIVAGALKYFDGQRYDLVAWSIMPNHVHVIVRPLEGHDLPSILHSWKSFTAKQANRQLGTTGPFWQEEYYDHLIRDEADFNHHLNYLLQNAERAGFTGWPWVAAGQADMHGQNHGQDARATHGRDALATEGDHGQDARVTQGRDALATTHGQDARDTNMGKMPMPQRIEYVTVATTRPETMLGDTAVAMNPADPRAGALVGRKVRLPIVGREIPIIADEHVVLPNPESDDEKAQFSTGFLKVTPAHDPDDWAIGERHYEEIANAIIPQDFGGDPRQYVFLNVMAPDGSISHKFGWADWENVKNADVESIIGMDRFEAREAIVEWFRKEDLLEDVREYVHEVGHSYRSHVPIEPYLSDQWYIAVKKPIEHLAAKFGDGLIEGTDVPVNSLAGLALKPLLDGRLRFIPERYAKTYQTWLENLRDWPISRQLWWGHRIPMWSKCGSGGWLENELFKTARDKVIFEQTDSDQGPITYCCVAPGNEEIERQLEAAGFERDDDVLDTWFSSALWPFSTLGWPDDVAEMKAFYPGDVLCTAREIITLWVSRMVMMGQYCAGDIPFKDVYIHAMIQDGQGRKMSKSLGNGIDPLIAIDSHGADAMRFTLASMTTDTQDIRMPVAPMELPDGRVVNTSPKFDIGRNFCNKLWNASRFAMMNLEGTDASKFDPARMDITDRWILSRLAKTVAEVTSLLDGFKYNEPLTAIYKFFWNDLCDWYLEWAKPRMLDEGQRPTAQNVLAFVLDQTLRLLHPFIPFITEGIFGNLNQIAPTRGVGAFGKAAGSEAIIIAEWPEANEGALNDDAEREISTIQSVIRVLRDIRSRYNIAPSKKLTVTVSASEETAAVLERNRVLIESLGNVGDFRTGVAVDKPEDAASGIVEGAQVYVHGAVDRRAERERLEKKKQELENGIGPLEAKLGNENFVTRAKPEVVQQARDRLKELSEQLEAVNRNLAEPGD